MDSVVLLEKAGGYLPKEKLAMVEAAYQFALKTYQGQKKKSGEPYMEHPLETALILAELELDSSTLVASLLHDVPEDCSVPLSEIEHNFGSEVRKLVETTTKLDKITWRSSGETITTQKRYSRRGSQAEYLRRMLIAMAEDLRVVFIKLADRLQTMRALGALSPEKRRVVAKETLEIYAPLAHRLGIWEIKWQLEDLAFRYLDPQQYHRVARLLASRRSQRESFVNEIVQTLETELNRAGIKAEVVGRPKHIYSIHKKMEKYSALGKDFGDVHDLFAFRVLVDTVSDCYKSLGVVHNLWHPFPEEIDDFIANPKANGYQSLHTTVMGPGMMPIEIQIRTYEMHRISEYGAAAHWRYKEGKTTDLFFEQKLAWLRQLIEWQEELSSEEFLELVKTDVFIDQVFVYTPKGEIIDLAKGATPLDFAYRIHTELGHRCVGAKVNNRLVPLNYELKSGEIVEILTSKGVKGPSLDWLNPDLGYIKTAHAKEKIRQWFKKQERTQNIERGRQLLDKELKRLGVNLTNLEKIVKMFNFEDADEFFAALGYGGITPGQVALKLVEPEPQRTPVEAPPLKKISPATIAVLGVGDLLTRLARCCHPLPGDEIIGYITRGCGVTVHRRNCHNILNQLEKERLIDVNWGSAQEVYPVVIQVDAWDRVGLLRDITTIIAEDKINITSVNMMEPTDNIVSILLTLEIKNIVQLTRLLSRIQGVRSVINTARRSEIGADPYLKT